MSSSQEEPPQNSLESTKEHTTPGMLELHKLTSLPEVAYYIPEFISEEEEENLLATGIMPHEDGAAYYPIVATVSLGAPIVLDIFDKRQEDQQEQGISDKKMMTGCLAPSYRILQERRSLLVTAGKLYSDYLHGIAEKLVDDDLGPGTICNWESLGNPDTFKLGKYERKTRISLTYRDVLKMSKLGNSLKFLSKKLIQ
ncbi:hypothetical protein FQN57_001931 [Myotisia sp. PD_48]|nr:hypothetical protein FQN57_001931 [Myotisia sp. PD_48]